MKASSPLSRWTFPLLIQAALLGGLQAAGLTVTVEGGEQGREAGLVRFTVPAQSEYFPQLITPDGKTLQLQKTSDGKTWSFICPAIPAGAKLVAKESWGKSVEDSEIIHLTGTADTLQFQYGSKPFFTYQTEASKAPPGISDDFRHGAYLHPVYSPSGKRVTGDYPPDHPHQRGIFMAWTKTEFEGRHPDFWNMGKGKDGKLTGEVTFRHVDSQWSGLVYGGFNSGHRWLDHTSGAEKEVLRETWNVIGYVVQIAGAPAYILDLVSTQTCLGQEPMKLPKYHYGGLGVRGPEQWDPVDKVAMLTSTGADRIKGDGTKASWVWLGGEVDGTLTGTAVLMHPDNFRFPQPLRLNPKNPQLCIAPSAEGDWSIEPGKPLVLRYRFVIRDGKPDAALLDRLLHDYANPAKVMVAPN